MAPVPEIARSFESRNLTVVLAELQQCGGQFNAARAMVVCFPNEADFRLIAEDLLRQALAHGLMVRVVVPLDLVIPYDKVLDAVAPLGNTGLLVVRQTELAEEIARHDPGPAFDSTVKLVGESNFSREQEILLRRAFHDCNQVEFRKMDDGTAAVYTAFVQLRDSQVGPYPLPMFVKLDKRHRIEQEWRHYKECTTLFIPFHARPNLHSDKCLLGVESGLLVGDFVERSEGLLDIVKRGVAQSAIDSLFQDALRGWRAQTHWSGGSGTVERIFDVDWFSGLKETKRERLNQYSRDARPLGFDSEVSTIVEGLRSLPPIAHYRGLTHGDLHCGNVRVRAGEAILIDFHSVFKGALSSDPATLEVSLALEVPGDETAWRAVMQELYCAGNLRTVPKPRATNAAFHQLWDAVRQVRRYGLSEQISETEYSQAVAIQLLKKATYKRNSGEQESRRPLMIKLAAEIVQGLVASEAAAAAGRTSSACATNAEPAQA